MDEIPTQPARRAFLLGGGALLGGSLIGRSQAAEPHHKGGMIVNSRILDHHRTPGACEFRDRFPSDSSAMFQAGDRKFQWCYEMQSRISVLTDSGRAPCDGPHRMVSVHVLATARIHLDEVDGESGVPTGLEWALDPVSLAFVAERRGDRIEIVGPVGQLASARLGMQVALDFRVEEIKGDEAGEAHDYSEPGMFRVHPALHRVAVGFNALEPDFSKFDLESVFRTIEQRLQLPPDSLRRERPLGSANGMHEIRFSAVDHEQ